MFEHSPIRIVIAGFRAFWLDPVTARMIPEVRGGDGPVDETTPSDVDVPPNFDGIDEDALRELHAKLEAKFKAERTDAKTRAQVDALRGYREAQKRIADEITRRQTETVEMADSLRVLDETVELPSEPDSAAEPDPAEVVVPPVDPAAPVDADAPTPEAIAAGLTATGVAGARTPQTAAQQAPVAARTRPRAAMTAAASQQIVPFGTEVSLMRIGEIADQVKNQLRPKGEQVKAYVASVAAYEDMGSELGIEILSTANGYQRNDQLIREAVEAHQVRRAEKMGRPKPVTAAICDPLDIIRDIPDYVSQADPFASALPSRAISRLGFNFTPAITLAGVTSGAQAGWDDTDQALVDADDSATWKPCLDAVCGSPCEVTATAATACMTFDVTTEMSNPERIRDIMSKLTAARIRARTIQLLDLMDALSIQYTRTGDYSLLPDTIYAVETTLARITYPERLDAEDYTLFLPHGFGRMLVADVHGKDGMVNDEYAESLTRILTRLSTILGVDIVDLRDETDATWDTPLPAVNDPTALSDGPCEWPLRLIHTPSALYGSTGVIDTGVQADPQLMRQNKRQWFQEEFALLTKHGSPPWAKITLTSAASGSRAATSTALACA